MLSNPSFWSFSQQETHSLFPRTFVCPFLFPSSQKKRVPTYPFLLQHPGSKRTETYVPLHFPSKSQSQQTNPTFFGTGESKSPKQCPRSHANIGRAFFSSFLGAGATWPAHLVRARWGTPAPWGRGEGWLCLPLWAVSPEKLHLVFTA